CASRRSKRRASRTGGCALRLSRADAVCGESARAANSVFTLPPVGGGASEAKRVGGVRARASIASGNDPHPQPLPRPLPACPLPADLKVTKPRQAGVGWGGELTERAALFCVKSKGPRFNSGRARRGGTVSTQVINHAA